MPESTRGTPFTLSDVDFEKAYAGEKLAPGVDLTFDVIPWDIGEPQPFVPELDRAGGLRSEVLDVGCGLGENALFLAGRGYRVTGVDGAETALARARARATEEGLEVGFVQDDVTALTTLEEGRFGSVLDSALYHCLGDEQRTAYAAALHRVTKPGAALHVFCFADVELGLGFPQAVSQDDLRTHLGGHWDIQGIEPTTYVTALTRDFFTTRAPMLAAMGISADPDQLAYDEQGRITGTMWHLTGVRR